MGESKIRYDVPNAARVWNYLVGGKDWYQADEEAMRAWAEIDPDVVPYAQQSGPFRARVVRCLAAEMGIRQFLDIGTGLPAALNTHEVAQSVAPDSKIVYVDSDPVVLAHARALLTNTTDEGVTDYLDLDVRNPEQIVADARNVLNFKLPIAVLFMGVLGHIADLDEACSIVRMVMDAVVPGSYFAQYDGLATPNALRAQMEYEDAGAVPYCNRSPDEMARFYEGLDMLEPGLVSISRWRPNVAEVGSAVPPEVVGYGGVARKP